MIVQCQACQTRFRLADEKVKPEGTKVRCSKCKEIFTVTPPEPEPVEESVDFGSFNMEAVEEETSQKAEPEEAQAPTEPPAPEEAGTTPPESIDESQPDPPAEEESSEIDFSGLEAEMGSEAGAGDELADDFSFADTSEPAEEEQAEEPSFPASEFSMSEDERTKSTEADQDDFGAAFEESDESADSMEFDFSEEQADAAEDGGFELESTSLESEASFEVSSGPDEADASATDEFSFDDEQAEAPPEGTEEFAFGDDEDASAFSFDDEPEEAGSGATDEFSFDEENPFGDDSASEWSDDDSGEAPSFDFEEPQFDTDAEAAPAAKPLAGGDEGGLQFGEIDFASDGGEGESDDFSSATLETQEPETFSPREQSPPPSRSYDADEPLPAPPPPPKKSSLSRVLVLLVLLLVVLGGAAGFLVMQGGTLNPQTLTEYLPFLEEYIGKAPATAPAQSIDINISGSSYVNGQAGQMLVIQGAAVNKHPSSRSSITIKGVLLDANGKTLLQQTVFCGNRLSDEVLETLPFKSIEEAMNNEFGDGLSNMNVASGASIPFTIVFRNLPDGIANINVEVVDSKPGAS